MISAQLSILAGALAALVALAAVYHFAGRPPLASRYPLTFWLVDIVVLPVMVMIVSTLASAAAIGMGFVEEGGRNVFGIGLFHLVGVWLAARGLELVVWRVVFPKRVGRSAPALLKGLTYTLLFVAGLALFLWWIEYPVTGFLVSTGVVVGIIGLALQKTLSDLFSGIALSLERPFNMGDWIELRDGTVGQVVDMTWRSTRLKTFYNTIVAVPNSNLAAEPVINLDRPTPPYSIWYYVKLSPQIEPLLAQTLLTTAVARCRHVLTQPAPVVRLSDASESPYRYMVWVHYRNYLAHFRAQAELFREIHAALRDADVRPAAPFQEVKFERAWPVTPVAPNISQTLRSFELFSNLNDATIDQIASGSHYSFIEADSELMREGADVDSVQILVSGSLRGGLTLASGHMVETVTLSPGESIGWAALVCGEEAFMTVTAVVDSLVVEIDGESIKPVLQSNPQLKRRLAELVLERMQRAGAARAASGGGPRGRTIDEILKWIESFLSRSVDN